MRFGVSFVRFEGIISLIAYKHGTNTQLLDVNLQFVCVLFHFTIICDHTHTHVTFEWLNQMSVCNSHEFPHLVSFHSLCDQFFFLFIIAVAVVFWLNSLKFLLEIVSACCCFFPIFNDLPPTALKWPIVNVTSYENVFNIQTQVYNGFFFLFRINWLSSLNSLIRILFSTHSTSSQKWNNLRFEVRGL